MPSAVKQDAIDRAAPVMPVRIGVYLLAVLWLVVFILVAVQMVSLSSKYSSVKDPSTAGLLPLASTISFSLLVIPTALAAFLMYMTYRRRRWALILLIGLTAVDLGFYFSSVFQYGIGSSLLDYAAAPFNAGKLVAIALLLSPQSLTWFKGREFRASDRSNT